MSDRGDREEKAYNGTLRRVLWGDSKETVIEKLTVNGFDSSESEAIYRRAFSERVSTIRSVFWRRIALGISLILLGLGVGAITWFITGGFAVTNVRIIAIPTLPIAWGAWKLLNGLGGVIGAPSMTGPVSDID